MDRSISRRRVHPTLEGLEGRALLSGPGHLAGVGAPPAQVAPPAASRTVLDGIVQGTVRPWLGPTTGGEPAFVLSGSGQLATVGCAGRRFHDADARRGEPFRHPDPRDAPRQRHPRPGGPAGDLGPAGVGVPLRRPARHGRLLRRDGHRHGLPGPAAGPTSRVSCRHAVHVPAPIGPHPRLSPWGPMTRPSLHGVTGGTLR